MNKRGQTMGLAILTTIAVFVIGFMFINFLMPEVSVFRAELSCASPSAITSGTKLLCLFGDLTIPLIILGVFSLGIGAITSRLNL